MVLPSVCSFTLPRRTRHSAHCCTTTCHSTSILTRTGSSSPSTHSAYRAASLHWRTTTTTTAGVLIGQHSYCTQELVNLAITGTAVSNVFDGHKSMDGMLMKGIPATAAGSSGSTVGMLSLFEHYGYVEVGSVLKRPCYPVWIVCSESHYSVLYCEEDGNKQQQQAAAVGGKDGWVKFDLFYYDELIKQQEVIRLTVDCSITSSDAPRSKELEPPLNDCIRTRWGKHARVSWNGQSQYCNSSSGTVRVVFMW